jgi:HNH endonuclease
MASQVNRAIRTTSKGGAVMAQVDHRDIVRVAVDLPMNLQLALIDDPAAGWAYVVALCYCGRNRTACAPLAATLRTAGVRKGTARKLIGAGLWHNPGHDCEGCPQPAGGEVAVHNDDMFVPSPAQAWRPTIRAALRQAVHERDGYSCLACGATDGLSLDHVFPWSLGGEDTYENLQTLCLPCNKRKGASR